VRWNCHTGKTALQKLLLYKKYNEEFYHPNIHPDNFKKNQKRPWRRKVHADCPSCLDIFLMKMFYSIV
jgi:uridine kinase